MFSKSEVNTLRKRIVRSVYKDEYFLYDLVWVDDEITMKPMPEYEGKEIIDSEYIPPKKVKKIKREIIKKYTTRGRPKIPKTDNLPVKLKIGRPKLIDKEIKSQFFENFQPFRPIVSNETTRSARLVIVNSRMSESAIRYYCQEVSSFYLPKIQIDKLIDLSWYFISSTQVTYYNTDLKLEEDYTLPNHYVEKDFYTPENIEKRKLWLKEARARVAIFEELQKEDERLILDFITEFNTLTLNMYSKNVDIDYNVKSKLYYKKLKDGNTNVREITAADIIEFEKNWNEVYSKLKAKRNGLKEIIMKNDAEHPDVNEKVMLSFKPLTIDVLDEDQLTMVQLIDLKNNYVNQFEKYLDLKLTRLHEKNLKIVYEIIDKYDHVNKEVNDLVKRKLLIKELEDMNTIELEVLGNFWPKAFNKISKTPKITDELDAFYAS